MSLSRDAQGRTSLFLSISGQHENASKVLLEAGADINSEDMNGVKVKDLARKLRIVELVNQCR